MRNIIVGTAGHIDHGKTALVRALTGIDTDRLEEEKRRGISIDLGFAHMDLGPDLCVGFVDVPGHERFVKNMLAGAAGIDLLLFVIAADESIKPQTREHFDICRLLDVRRGIVVLTKSDLVDHEILDLVKLEVEEFVRGSFLEAAPVVAVSSTTGAGLEQLRQAIGCVAAEVTVKDASHHFRLPVDRCFAMKGFGTVVTGTLKSGSVSVEQEIEIHPIARHARVRGVQVHGESVPAATAGQRTALNLAGIEAAEVARGMEATPPGLFHPSRRIDTQFELLPSAKPLKHRAPVHFHAGTAEVEAEARLLDGSSALAPGHRAFVRFLLRDPLLILPGDRFIVRMFSPVVTIGGGKALDIDPPRRRDPAGRLEVLAEGGVADRVALLVREAPYGVSRDSIVARTGLTVPELEAACDARRLVALRAPQTWLIDREWFAQAEQRLVRALDEFHREKPLLPGMPKEELRACELPDSPSFLLDALLSVSQAVVAEGETLRLASHQVALKHDEEQALGHIEGAFRQGGLAVPAVQEVLARCGLEVSRARSLLQILLRDRRLVRVSDDLIFHASAIESLKEMVKSHHGQRFAVPEFKDWTGISRKYAIPLLEFLDRERVTRREGDLRVVL